MIISSSAAIERAGFQKLLINHRVKDKSKTFPFTSAVIIKLAGTSQLLEQTIKSKKNMRSVVHFERSKMLYV